ncbi:HpcH/HpaI aldolase, partial [sediment metagenome]
MKLFLFTTDEAMAREAQDAGVDSIIVDWEFRGKEERQEGHNLEINRDTLGDLQRLVKACSIPVTVRVNALSDASRDEIDLAIGNGAHIIMLPMARSALDVENFLKMVDSRARTFIQVETVSLAESVKDIRDLPWDYAYIGLNDLSVQRKSLSIWEAVLDGMIERICRTLQGRVFGFG